jgi:hypothetical protein
VRRVLSGGMKQGTGEGWHSLQQTTDGIIISIGKRDIRGEAGGQPEVQQSRVVCTNMPHKLGPLTANVQQGKNMRGRQIPGPPSAGAAEQDRGGDEMREGIREKCDRRC